MIIDNQRSLLFVHIPKTGGESFSQVLRSHGAVDFLDKHATIRDYANVSSDIPRHSLAVVRNPFDQVVSFYFHLRKPLYIPKDQLRKQYPHLGGEYVGPVEACKLAIRSSFSQFVDSIYYRGCIPHPYFQDQAEFICGNEGQILCSEVFKYESITRLWNRLCVIYGIPSIDIPHLNRSRRVHYSQYYDNRTREIIDGFFSKTLTTFGYCFGEAMCAAHPMPYRVPEVLVK